MKILRKILKITNFVLFLMFKFFNKLASFKIFSSARFDALEKDFEIVQYKKILFLISTKDKLISKELFKQGYSDFEKFEKAHRLLGFQKKNILNLIDIGANIGSIGIIALKKKFVSKCYFFEPSPLNFKILKNNIILNDLENNSYAYEIALGSQKGHANLQLSKDDFGDHRINFDSSTDPKKKAIKVSVEDLDHYSTIIDPSESLIKIDTQGCEGHVLEGAGKYTNFGTPLIMEFWPFGLKNCKGFELLLKNLSQSNYNFFIDLKDVKNKQIDITSNNLKALYDKIGDRGNFTDLLIF